MDFAFTAEQEAVRDTARRFARERLAPSYLEGTGPDRFDRGLVGEMGSLGLIAPDLAEDYGGLGVDGVTAGIVAEEIGYADVNAGYLQILGTLCGRILQDHARPPVAARWVPRIVAGECLMALALTEPRGGSDAANLQLKASRAADGSYVLNGEKTSISFSDQADGAVVFARTGAPDAGARGISAFLVPLDLPGVSRTRFDDLGGRRVGRGSIFFDGATVPADHLLGEEGGGFYQVMQGFDYSRALIGLQVLGAARASLDESWTYIGERPAFGRPLAQFQGVSFPLAEAETLHAAARLLCYDALWKRDRGMPHTAEAAMCKWLGPKTAVDAIHACLLTHGHAGYSRDSAHQQRLRDVIGLEIGDGTAQVMKLIVAREKAGRVAVQHAT